MFSYTDRRCRILRRDYKLLYKNVQACNLTKFSVSIDQANFAVAVTRLEFENTTSMIELRFGRLVCKRHKIICIYKIVNSHSDKNCLKSIRYQDRLVSENNENNVMHDCPFCCSWYTDDRTFLSSSSSSSSSLTCLHTSERVATQYLIY